LLRRQPGWGHPWLRPRAAHPRSTSTVPRSQPRPQSDGSPFHPLAHRPPSSVRPATCASPASLPAGQQVCHRRRSVQPGISSAVLIVKLPGRQAAGPSAPRVFDPSSNGIFFTWRSTTDVTGDRIRARRTMLGTGAVVTELTSRANGVYRPSFRRELTAPLYRSGMDPDQDDVLLSAGDAPWPRVLSGA